MDIWQYRTLSYNHLAASVSALHVLGKDGWEVCAVLESQKVVLLKRKINEK